MTHLNPSPPHLTSPRRTLLPLTLLLLLSASLHAQTIQPKRHWMRIGSDRDSLSYLIASPFDNWWLNVGGGLQTFIGNEEEASAKRNQLNYNLHIEVGKWVIPDVAASLRFAFMDVSGQTRYSLNPFVDFTGIPMDSTGHLPYQAFHEHAFALTGFVTLDWTNLLGGYERGRRNKLHIYMPVGLGASMLFGNQKNPNNSDFEVGDFRRNFELSFAVALGAEYAFSPRMSLLASVELFGSESTWDWSPYNNSRTIATIFDLIPSFNVSLRFNLIRDLHTYNPKTRRAEDMYDDRGFETFGSRQHLATVDDQLDQMTRLRDSLENLADDLLDDNNDLRNHINRLNSAIDSLDEELDKKPSVAVPTNVLGELILTNENLNLPATIIYYELDKFNIDYSSRKRLRDFARKINNLDDTLEFFLLGAADSLTGSIPHNRWLSRNRCNAAYNVLVNENNVDPNQLVVIPLGGITEFEPQENCRMAMVILKNPVTEEIVERWLRKRQP